MSVERSDVVLADHDPPELACLRFVRKTPDDAEMIVLAHIAAGLSDGEIGLVLGTSIGSVRWAARSVMAKLGASNRPHAVCRAISMGFLVLTERDAAGAEAEAETEVEAEAS